MGIPKEVPNAELTVFSQKVGTTYSAYCFNFQDLMLFAFASCSSVFLYFLFVIQLLICFETLTVYQQQYI